MALNFQQRSSVLLRRVLLVVLLVVSLVLITLYSREGNDGPLHTAQASVSGAMAPLTFAGGAVGSGVDSVQTGIDNITADESTLSGLREYNAQLIEALAQKQEIEQENERLRQMLALKDAYQIEGVGARVIGNPTNAWTQSVTIDKGSAEGVESGLTVMGPAGVIGMISSVGEHNATVRLLSDPDSGAAAMVQSSRAEGIVRGSLEGLLYMENLSADAVVNPGDIIITSGMGGSYTRGLIIGTVVKVENAQDEATRRVVVSANDSSAALEEVMVVFRAGSAASSSDTGTSGASDGDADTADTGTTDGAADTGDEGTEGGEA